MAATVIVIAVTGTLVWLVWRSPHRSDLSTFGAFAVAVIVPVASLVVYLTKVTQAGDTGPGRPLDELADSLAVAVTEQWTRAALERLLLQPEPIPVQWQGSARPLAGPTSAAVESRQFPPLPGLLRAVPGQLRGEMSREGTRDLAWWRIPAWTSAVPRVITTGVVFGLVFALGGSPVYGLVGGPVTAYFYMLVQKNYPPVRRAPLQWRHLLSRNSLVPGLQYALVAGALCGLFGLAARVGAGRTAALVAGIGIGIGLAGALTTGLARSATDNANPLTPRASWRSVQAFGLAVGLTLGLGLILGIGLGVGFILALGLGNHPWHVAGIVSGLVWVLGFGLVFGLVFPRTWAVSLTFAQLAMRWHTPARLLRFLDDARQRNVLRTVGPVYQFRHARLQDRLAGQAAPK
jgi:hypothetical protein